MKFILRILFVFFICISNSFALTLINDTEIENFLYEIVKPLSDSANIKNLKINIVNDDSFNAFISGGNIVFINSGLLIDIDDINSLQAVIAHELGHYLGGHLIQLSEKMKKEMYKSIIIQSLGIGLLATGNGNLGTGLIAGGGGVGKQGLLSFSRDEERLADDLGVDLMQKSNLNPKGFAKVFTSMQNKSFVIESKISPVNINHPLTSERLKNIKDKISKLSFKKYKKFDDRKLKFVKAKLIGYLKDSKSVKILYPENKKDLYSLYANSISNMQSGNLKIAKKQINTLIEKDKNNPFFYEILGEIEYKSGHFDKSIEAYEKTLLKVSNPSQIQTALAIVLSEYNRKGDKDYAISLCKKSLLKEPFALTYFILAKLYNDERSNWAFAEYYNLLHDKEKTKFYAKKATDKLPKKTPEYIKSKDLLDNN